jgi:hypothetical protein
MNKNTEPVFLLGEISGSHGGEHEDGCLLGCCAMQSGRSLPTFQRCLLPPSSGYSTLSLCVTANVFGTCWCSKRLRKSCEWFVYLGASPPHRSRNWDVWGSWGQTPRILNLGTRWMWVLSFTFRLLYPCIHWIEDWVGLRRDLDFVVKRKIPAGNWNPVVQPVAGHCTDWIIPVASHCTDWIIPRYIKGKRGTFNFVPKHHGSLLLDVVFNKNISVIQSPPREDDSRLTSSENYLYFVEPERLLTCSEKPATKTLSWTRRIHLTSSNIFIYDRSKSP